jgi:dephospho-CoA kinase
MDLIERLAGHQRVIIAGGPRTGKSTLATLAGERFGIPVKHADDLIETHKWSEASEEVSRWFNEPGPWIVEGVSAPRAIRKWLRQNPSSRLDATIVFLKEAVERQSIGQSVMHKGVNTVWLEVLPALRRSEVPIIERE